MAADEQAFVSQGARNVPELMDVMHDVWSDTGNELHNKQNHQANWLIVKRGIKAFLLEPASRSLFVIMSLTDLMSWRKCF